MYFDPSSLYQSQHPPKLLSNSFEPFIHAHYREERCPIDLLPSASAASASHNLISVPAARAASLMAENFPFRRYVASRVYGATERAVSCVAPSRSMLVRFKELVSFATEAAAVLFTTASVCIGVETVVRGPGSFMVCVLLTGVHWMLSDCGEVGRLRSVSVQYPLS